MREAWVLAVVSAALLGGCTPRVDGEAVRTQIMEADRAFARETAARRTDGWVEAFAENGVMFTGAQPVTGHDAIRATMAPAFADTTFRLEWGPTRAEVSAGGDLGYTVGRYVSSRIGADGRAIRGAGTYVTIWRRMETGQWKVVLDIGNADAPSDGN